jgi:tetratricopeptide (TPR) repeat protein
MHCREETSWRLAFFCGIAFVLLLSPLAETAAQEFEAAQKLFLTGKYDACLRACEAADPEGYRREEWQILHANTLLVVGRYPEAETVVSNALVRLPNSLRLRVAGFETANASGSTWRARRRLQEINELVNSRPWAYRDPVDMVALGRAALLMGVDARAVLEKFYGTAQKADPNLRDTYLASGELALSKHDYAIAAKTFTEALKKFPDDADVLHGLARAYEPSARARMVELIESALEKNENHVPSMLLLTDHLVDAEEYTEAEKTLDRALKVNPWHPEAWAYRAVLAHLRNEPASEAEARDKALHFWSTNPKVDHLIGRKLSQNYRFAEGAARQRQALEFNSEFLPARIQLAEDLLRLGDEGEGWELAEEVHKRDGYDVTAYNLVTLRGTMGKFATLTNADFIVRMSAKEAALYGDRALALLQRAKDRLTEKYGIRLEQPTIVEIFPEQKDFGVRTFGMPHNPGFLGVCFGNVVTANSPASQGGDPSNWEAVLWHEFCHVITLQLTKNKMPRWLSEGISVYEELQANPSWGQRMNPRYREMVLGDDLTPVSELSSAFMSPKSEFHVQFAYFQSSLVVEFLIEKFGFDKLKAILRDLGQGENINEAIPKHTAPMKEIEKEFAAFAKARAEALGPGLDWKKPERERGLLDRLGIGRSRSSVRAEAGEREAGSTNELKTALLNVLAPILTNAPGGAETAPVPNAAPQPEATKTETERRAKPNYWTLMEAAQRFIAQEKWEAAKAPLEEVVALYPDQSGPNNAYALLAAVCQGLKETGQERAALENWADSDGDALEAYQRLMQLGESDQDWKVVACNADRFLAVNPLLPQPYRFLARASEELGEATQAINAYQKVLLLDPPDPADVHFRLARLLGKANEPTAKRHVLQALEEAPRFRDAHRLLLELVEVKTEPASLGKPESTNPVEPTPSPSRAP